jgi:DNA processing protein
MPSSELVLALANMPFLTARERCSLAQKLDNTKELTVLSIEEISFIVGRRLRTTLWDPSSLAAIVGRQINLMERYSIGMESIDSPLYPPQLREIHDPPYCLFWRGTIPDYERPMVAMVGTRSPSATACRAAERIGRRFAELGVPVVSGLARGVDAFAHRGNAEAGAPSVAVLACGLERVYPAGNARIASLILDRLGAIVGEYPPLTEPLAFRFPQRNRIISALARAVVVVEAPSRSGALITADFALEQGRDLFVVADALSEERSRGTTRLCEEGAVAIKDADDVIDDWLLRGDRSPRVQEGRLAF